MRSNAVECNIFAQTTPKIFSLCPLKKCRAATNGANPAKFTRPRPRQNAKAEPSMHPDTKEIPRKAKRNRELADLPEIPYLCYVFLPTYRLHGILTAPPGFVRAGFFTACCADSAPASWRPFPADSCINSHTYTIRRKSRFPFGIWPLCQSPIRCKTRIVRW